MLKVSPKFIARAHFALKEKEQRGLYWRFLRHCNCSNNFWSKANMQTGVMVHLSLTYSIISFEKFDWLKGLQLGPWQYPAVWLGCLGACSYAIQKLYQAVLSHGLKSKVWRKKKKKGCKKCKGTKDPLGYWQMQLLNQNLIGL